MSFSVGRSDNAEWPYCYVPKLLNCHAHEEYYKTEVETIPKSIKVPARIKEFKVI